MAANRRKHNGRRRVEHESQREQYGTMGGNEQSDNANDATLRAGYNGHGRGDSLLKQDERNEPWKFVYQNIRCLVSENTQYKIKYLRDYTKTNKVMLINLTETWLNKNIQEDVKIEGYNEYRSDRIGAKQGGAIIYTLEDFECEVLERHSKGNCELIAVNIKSLNTINIVVYRPTGTNEENFSYII